MDIMCALPRLLIITLATVSVPTTTTNVNDTGTEVDQKTYCSKTDSRSCLTVFNGRFDFESAGNVCSNRGASEVDFSNESIIDHFSSVLSERGLAINLVVNARREVLRREMVDYEGNWYGYDGYMDAIVIKDGFFRWYASKEKWNMKYKFLCKRKNCSDILPGCYNLSLTGHNWFKGRRICRIYDSDFVTNVPKVLSLKLYGGDYWMGVSSFRWKWTGKDSKWFSSTPEWSDEYYENISTECATMKLNSHFVEWRAHVCGEETNLSVICQFNDSYVMLSSQKDYKIGDIFMIAIITIGVLILSLGTSFCVYILIIRSMKRKLSSNNEKTLKGYCLVKPNKNETEIKNLNYPHLELHDMAQSTEANYETIAYEDHSAIYMNSNIDYTYNNVGDKSSPRSVYCLGKSICSAVPGEGAPAGPRSPKSPVTLIDNDVYDSKKSSIKSLVKLCRKTGQYCHSDASNESTYEPLSPVSLGRRSAPEESNSDSSRHYSLETNPFDDYAKMISRNKEMQE